MKRNIYKKYSIVLVILLLACQGIVYAETTQSIFPSTFSQIFPDANLASAISEKFDRSPDDNVTESELKTNFRLFNLDISNRGIVSLEGLQYVLFTQLNAGNNQINDLSFLDNLVSLKQVNLEGNPITRLETLGSLPNLEVLTLNHTQLEDIQFSFIYPKMRSIYLSNTKIETLSDFSFNLPNLRDIYLDDTEFYDLSDLLPLANKLNIISVSNTKVVDFSVLSSFSVLSNFMSMSNPDANYNTLPEITTIGLLNLSNNELTDIEFLSVYSSIPSLMLNDNYIDSPDILKDIKIGLLHLEGNKIKDASWITSLQQVFHLYLNRNHISDITFLEDQTQFISVTIMEQTIDASTISLDKDSYTVQPIIKVFDGFESQLYVDDHLVSYQSDGVYSEVSDRFTWESVQAHSDLSYQWYQYFQSGSRYIYFGGVFVQPIDEIGFTVSYYHDNVLYHTERQVHEGSQIISPSAPLKEGYRFMGWYLDSSLTTVWNFNENRINTHLNLYSRFDEIIYHSVYFEITEGNRFSTEVEDKNLLERPEQPVREGYRFTGWYLDKDLKQVWNFDHTIESSMVLYAGWEKSITSPSQPDKNDGSIDIPTLDKIPSLGSSVSTVQNNAVNLILVGSMMVLIMSLIKLRELRILLDKKSK